jgi:hypothetical protein
LLAVIRKVKTLIREPFVTLVDKADLFL